MGAYTGRITGKLASQLTAVGSMSEGPIYFLIPEGKYSHWQEIAVRKKTNLWKKDPTLHGLIGKIVTVKGQIIETKDTITMDYSEILVGGKVLTPSSEKNEDDLPKKAINNQIRKISKN